MPVFATCRHFIPMLLALVLLPAQASAAPTLAEAIKQADAKYLDAKEIEPADAGPKIEAGMEEESEATNQEISQGSVRAALSYKEDKTEEGEVTRVPVVTVFADGAEVATLEGEDSGLSDPPVSVQIAELDPANATPEIVVSFFTGGAHCCSDTKVVISNKDGSGWRVVEIGQFDGGPLLASDLAGDGHPAFETRDNAFLYAFGCYACSTAPLKILALEDGKVKDVTAEPRFRPAHEAYLRNIITGVPDEDPNGFLAGYVAEKFLLGEGADSWKLMLDYYDKASDWGLEFLRQAARRWRKLPRQEREAHLPGRP